MSTLDDRDTLFGAFKDFDLRRSLDLDIGIKRESLGSVMVQKLVTVKASQFAVEAFELMGRDKFSVLPVVNELGGLVGALNIRILFRQALYEDQLMLATMIKSTESMA